MAEQAAKHLGHDQPERCDDGPGQDRGSHGRMSMIVPVPVVMPVVMRNARVGMCLHLSVFYVDTLPCAASALSACWMVDNTQP